MHNNAAPPTSTGFDLTFPAILDMTLRYHRFRLLPEHPDLRPTLQTAVDTMFAEAEPHSGWLLNPRTGYCYPVEDGIPILLKEEGKKYQNTVFIA